VKQYMTNLVVF